MKRSLLLPFTLLVTLPLMAQEGALASPARERAYFGVVAQEAAAQQGLLVGAVAPASPAGKAGIREGDRLLRVGQQSVSCREDLRRAVAAAAPGDLLLVEVQRAQQRMTLQVMLEPRPETSSRPAHAEAALGADRRIHPIALPEEIRREIRRHRRLLREQLASLPDGLVPAVVTEELNAIRNLARDAHANRPGWMSGRAGEISVRFRDDEGSVVLYGANNLVSVELYNAEGELFSRYELNTEAQRRALPPAVLQRLQHLR